MKKIVRFLVSAEEFLIWGVTLQMVLLTFVQVVLRYAFHSALSWGEELLRVEVVLVTFMGAALGVKYGSHIGVDVVRKFSPPRVRAVLAIVVHLLTGAFSLLLFYLSLQTMLKVGSSGQLTPALRIPKYFLYLPIPIGTLIIGVRSAMQICVLLVKRPLVQGGEDTER
jgi:C4-dicarboxylate transporter, DctQ subunit